MRNSDDICICPATLPGTGGDPSAARHHSTAESQHEAEVESAQQRGQEGEREDSSPADGGGGRLGEQHSQHREPIATQYTYLLLHPLRGNMG